VNKISPEKGRIIIYAPQKENVKVEVQLIHENVWLTQQMIGDLFQTERSVVTKHLNNIFSTGELSEKSVCAIFAHTAPDGKTYKTKFYDLDAIISVGYRVNSHRATKFRIWASHILKKYLIKGYAINEKRLAEAHGRLEELRNAIKFIRDKSKLPELTGNEASFLSLIEEYADSLSLLYQYDKQTVRIQKKQKAKFVLSFVDCQKLIVEARIALARKLETTDLFGQEIGTKFQSALGTIYQTFDKKELYATLTEKSANLFYLIIKDHPFTDGNKRIASLLFIYFLERNNFLRRENGEKKIDNGTIVALSLLIANSQPGEKDIMVKIITNLLK
jgi:death-on-curing family protein